MHGLPQSTVLVLMSGALGALCLVTDPVSLCVDSVHHEGGMFPACEHFLIHMWENVVTRCTLTATLDVVSGELRANRCAVSPTLAYPGQPLQVAAADRKLRAGNATFLTLQSAEPMSSMQDQC